MNVLLQLFSPMECSWYTVVTSKVIIWPHCFLKVCMVSRVITWPHYFLKVCMVIRTYVIFFGSLSPMFFATCMSWWRKTFPSHANALLFSDKFFVHMSVTMDVKCVWWNEGGIAQGPSSTQDAYLVPYTNNTGVFLKAIISMGDKADNGCLDGLGVYNNWNGTFTVVIAHEIAAGLDAVRKHGANIGTINGAFVAKWKIQKNDCKVVKEEDLIKEVFACDRFAMAHKVPETSPPVTMGRFCSATLAPITTFFNPKSRKGTVDRIFMNGEESGSGSRASAHVITGPSAGSTWDLPRLGHDSFENTAPDFGCGKFIIFWARSAIFLKPMSFFCFHFWSQHYWNPTDLMSYPFVNFVTILVSTKRKCHICGCIIVLNKLTLRQSKHTSAHLTTYHSKINVPLK